MLGAILKVLDTFEFVVTRMGGGGDAVFLGSGRTVNVVLTMSGESEMSRKES